MVDKKAAIVPVVILLIALILVTLGSCQKDADIRFARRTGYDEGYDAASEKLSEEIKDAYEEGYEKGQDHALYDLDRRVNQLLDTRINDILDDLGGRFGVSGEDAAFVFDEYLAGRASKRELRAAMDSMSEFYYEVYSIPWSIAMSDLVK